MAFALVAVVSLAFVACGDDKDEPGGSGKLEGTWMGELTGSDGGFPVEDKSYVQFKSNGTFASVSIIKYLEDFADYEKGDTEIDISKGTWRVDGEYLYTTLTETTSEDMKGDIGKTEVDIYKVKGNKLTVTTTISAIVSFTYDRVSDSEIEKYLH